MFQNQAGRPVKPNDILAGIPFMGVGAYPAIDDTAKIAQLFQDGGRFEGQQLLHPAKTGEALYRAGLAGSTSLGLATN